MIGVSVLVSSLAGGWFDLLVEALREERLQPILSHALLEKLRDVVSRDRLRRWFDLDDANDLSPRLGKLNRWWWNRSPPFLPAVIPTTTTFSPWRKPRERSIS